MGPGSEVRVFEILAFGRMAARISVGLATAVAGREELCLPGQPCYSETASWKV